MSWIIWAIIGMVSLVVVGFILYWLGYIFYKAWEDIKERPKF